MNEDTTWAERIRFLEGVGYSMTSIAKLCGLTIQALSDLKHERSTEPKGMAAVKLHRLHQHAVRKAA